MCLDSITTSSHLFPVSLSHLTQRKIRGMRNDKRKEKWQVTGGKHWGCIRIQLTALVSFPYIVGFPTEKQKNMSTRFLWNKTFPLKPSTESWNNEEIMSKAFLISIQKRQYKTISGCLMPMIYRQPVLLLFQRWPNKAITERVITDYNRSLEEFREFPHTPQTNFIAGPFFFADM